jgi:hypothetical protein
MWQQGKQSVPGSKQRHSWSLSGEEVLLELEYRDGSRPHGIYAINPFERAPSPKLLIKGGERPCWSAKRNFFAYIHGEYLRIARKGGNEDVWVLVADFEQGHHEPLVIWNQREGFTLLDRDTGYGSLSYPVIKSLLAYPSLPKYGTKDPFTFIPLKEAKPMPLEGKREPAKEEWWNDLLAANNLSFSPDTRYFAAEVYPTPRDLRRGESRIYLFEEDSEQIPKVRWYHWGLILHAPGRRLTLLNGNTCELNPLWHPRGDWIAFTLVDFDQGYVVPAVIRPDGSNLTFLLPCPDALPRTGPWTRYGVSQVDNRAYRKRGVSLSSFRGWGTPNLQAVQWSPEGRYLLLNEGRLYTDLRVVKQVGVHWMGKIVGGQNFLRLVQWCAKPGWLSFVRGLRPMIHGDRGDAIELVNVERDERRVVTVGEAAIIHWMSA